MSYIQTLQAQVLKPDIEYRPELRWWLASGSHTTRTLKDEIRKAYELGFGGMEFLAMPEHGISLSRYGWGSEEWLRSSQVVVEETTERGMSVSFTSGTHWSNANIPGIDSDHPAAAQELNYTSRTLSPGERWNAPIPRINLKASFDEVHAIFGDPAEVKQQTFVAVVAAQVIDESEAATTLDLDTLDLTSSVTDEHLDWTAPDGQWKLFFFWRHGTGQTAQPSTTTNYTVNYLDPEGSQALIAYWRDVALSPTLRNILASNKRVQMYMDSLELSTRGAGGLLWGRTVAAEFERRRGYSITRYLPFLVRVVGLMACDTVYTFESTAEGKSTVDKVRHDLAATFTDLYIENMLRPFRAFLNSVGIQLRAEISYGAPFEISRPGTEVDGIETESLEFGSQVDAYRLLAGVAHLFGKQYSSETGANMRNFMLNHEFYDQIIKTQFAVGCSKTVMHGWASMTGAEGTKWPGHEGMLPLFSDRFDTRQPGSEFYPLWSTALARTQFFLRQGVPKIDVGILRTDHAVDNLSGTAFKGTDGSRIPDEVAYGTMWMRDRQNHWWEDLSMQDAGFTYDFFDGQLLLDERVSFANGVIQPHGPGYQALIIYQSTLNPEVAELVLQWARDGLPVLLVHNTRETKFLIRKEYHYHSAAASATPGLDGRDAELSNTISELLQLPNTAAIDDPAQTVDTLRRLGVHGRASFTEQNQNILSHLREGKGGLLHLYLYHLLYETGKPTEVTVALEGQGQVYSIDPYSGSVRPYTHYTQRDGTTYLHVRLSPGETGLFTLDRTAGSSAQPSNISTLPEPIKLSDWELVVESWDAGEVEFINEESGRGYPIIEHKPHVAVTKLHAGRLAQLEPWSQIASVGPNVSGVGEYTSTFEIAHVDQNTRYILNLGNTCGGLGSIKVNDGPLRGFDTSVPKSDVTEDLRPGVNRVTIRVSSSLNNRLRANGYFDKIREFPFMGALHGEWVSEEQRLLVRDYGLLGPVTLSAE